MPPARSPAYPPSIGYSTADGATAAAHDEWAVTAHHEAGHVAAYCHHRWRFGIVKIWQAEDGSITGSVLSPASQYDRIKRASVCLAGPLAEQRLTGVPPHRQPGSRSDLAMAREALARLDYVKPRPDIAALMPTAKLLVDAEWPAIERIARRLVVCRELDYDEVRELLFAPD